MLVFIWIIVSLSTNNGALGQKKECQQPGYCVTLSTTITAEAGLCAVIPCSFTSEFEPKVIIWFKCENPQNPCSNSDPVFHSDKSNTDIQSGFKGHVSLLEPDVTHRNCSIIINDLRKSDSGYYLLRVEGDRRGDKYSYTVLYTNLSVKDLNPKPEIKIPPLIEGQQVTLSCTAPGFCSGSPPKITWMWRRKGEKEKSFQGNTTSKTENLTAVKQIHSSTLTFKPSAEHHNTNITCQVSFTGGKTTEETETLNVNYFRKPQIFGKTTVKEGDHLNLTCSVDSFPPSVIKWNKVGTDFNLQYNILNKSYNSTKTFLNESHHNSSLLIINVTSEDAGRYICTATYLNDTLTKEVIVNYSCLSCSFVALFSHTDLRNPQIFGKTTVKEGDDLNLTCSVDSFPPSVIKWTKVGTETDLQHISNHSYNTTENNTKWKHGNGSFSITNKSAEFSGLYSCAVEHLMEEIKVTLTYKRDPQVFRNATVKKEVVLNLSCSIDRFPPSYIRWMKSGTETGLNRNISEVNNSLEIYQQYQLENVSFTIKNVSMKDAAPHICTATYQGMEGEIHVKYKMTPKTIGNQTVKDALNMPCTENSFHPSLIIWTDHAGSIKPTSNTSLHKIGALDKLVIFNITREDSARYVCTATYMNSKMTVYADIKVTWLPKVVNGSGCRLCSTVLICSCISDGFPLPTIKWPLLNNHTEYSVINMVSTHILNSTVTINVDILNSTSVECISSNENGEAQEKLRVQKHCQGPEAITCTQILSEKAAMLQIAIAFCAGFLLSAIICCLFMKFYRKKRKHSGNVGQSLEMVSPLMHNSRATEGGLSHRGLQEGALAAAPEAAGCPRELVYACIDFSLMAQLPRKRVKSSENTNTEYSEIQIKKKEMNDSEKESELAEMKTEEEEKENYAEKEKEEKEEVVYSSVQDLLTGN
ncbi:sialic acid-binding Ig-like lectin 11 [Cyprinodon tularosa]|uniref:sialic acid-binding Ig-like lectin 11 n=1 Tax=Cyprinodon tularosa TaxID=77115 RepID=UPI0018E2432A|nr:sialic acid-binding Ig-like lectin 11 [Cyprinodon tularosa]